MTNTLPPRSASLANTIEAPGLLFASCLDVAAGHWYGAGIDATVYRVDLSTEKPVAAACWKHHDNYVSGLAWLDGVVVSCGFDRRLIWTRAESGEKFREVAAHDGWVRDLVVLPGGQRIATVGDDMLVKFWDATTGELVRAFDGHERRTPEGYPNALYAVAASRCGKWLASADRIGAVRVWDVETGQLVNRLASPEFYTFDEKKRARSIGGIRSLAFFPDEQRLALGGIGPVSNVDGFVGPARFEVWDWPSATMLHRGQDKHHAILEHIEYAADWGLLIGAGGGDAGPFLALWDLTAEAPIHKPEAKSHIQHFLLDPTARRLLAVGHDGFQLWTLSEQP